MATRAIAKIESSRLKLEPIARFPGLRVLAWDRETLYASSRYRLLRAWPAHARSADAKIRWNAVAHYRPELWRTLTSRNALSYRLVRDGFHALAILANGSLVAAVPGAIVTATAGDSEFRVSHRITRGTRPLQITAMPDGRIYWGEYFDNATRDEVHIYASSDAGSTWHVAHTFSKKSIRHVHNIVYDRWQDCLWIFTGDYGRECRILRTSLDLTTVDEVLAGDQQARAVAAVVTSDGLFFASDTPLEQNYIYRLGRDGVIDRLHALPASSIYGCQNRDGLFFSTMVEPSKYNPTRDARVFGSAAGCDWDQLTAWRKDRWPMKWFQYGNAVLPDGNNETDLLALTTIAVENADLETSIWRTIRA